ncbi:MAG TPA: MarR family transcriptional regulator [Acidiferrobacteraceae bacterium]|nr:MarR family transcriptional regulator [Acidiferrobacteraceae bacterium]
MPGSAELAPLLHETAHLWRQALDRRLRPLGLSQAKWRTLVHLARATEPLTQKELACRLGVEAATVVGLLDRLQADGWIERRPSTIDRRRNTVHLTPQTAPVLSEINRVAAEVRAELLAGVSETDLSRCLAVLTLLHARAGALVQQREGEDHGAE